MMLKPKSLIRDDNRIIIHFDYDCFYASVVEHENPALKFVPLIIQQKQIVVTCNYEARRRGLHKLQLMTEAKKACPEAVVVLGEDISRFRDASKDLLAFVTSCIWSNRAERLGFDEVWLDCTDMIDYNLEVLNVNDLSHSFFCLDKNDPTLGFKYDASAVYGPTYPKIEACPNSLSEEDRRLHQRLILGSHLARHLRHELEHQKGYTATVGISTNKLLSKLVGNANKPMSQTTLIPPLTGYGDDVGTVIGFMDTHEIGKVPGIGFKLAQRLRAHVLGHQPEIQTGLLYGQTRENVTVQDVRCFPGMGPQMLEDVLSGPGSPKGIGGKMWDLLHGIDETEVGVKKRVPSQISQEDSYMKYLHTFEQVRHQLYVLAERLIRRMHLDLTETDEFDETRGRKWLAHPRTLRLSTRPRPPVNADGQRQRTFHRISRSVPMPNFVFSFTETVPNLAERLVEEALVSMFRKLHPQRTGWNLSLINVAVTNMAESAADTRDSEGRDIGRMFRHQDDVLRDFKITEPAPHFLEDSTADEDDHHGDSRSDSGELESIVSDQKSGEGSADEVHICEFCQTPIPAFARAAHDRFHGMQD